MYYPKKPNRNLPLPLQRMRMRAMRRMAPHHHTTRLPCKLLYCNGAMCLYVRKPEEEKKKKGLVCFVVWCA